MDDIIDGLQGFISLDCGLSAEELSSPYDEPSTGLRFSSDAAYIQSGLTGSIQPNRESQYLKPYRTLRYFPNGSRNCYNLNVEKGSKYLVRAFFVYENYDGLNIKPKFDLYLGPKLWSTVEWQERDDVRRVEMLHIPTSNSLQICLVKNGTTIPLISTLEIRPVGNTIYETVSGSLNLYFRTFFNKSDTYIRYPSDRYDRVWTWYFRNEWTQISTTLQVEVNNLENDYDPPNAALTSAAIPTNSNLPLMINWTSRRECSLQLIRTNRSTLPPLINAHEVYTVIHFPQSETNENDVVSVQNIKTTYRISKNSWQGDPCVPQQLMWEGLNCRITDKSTPPRITYLNLSSSGLTGTIADYIQNLTQLETLDLSNNNLTGEVPEFLGNMKSLVFINLSRNDLSGLIPQALLRKGLLDPQGNPRLCLSDSCIPPKSKPFPVAIVASLASVAIILVVLVLAFVLKKKTRSILGALQRPPSISSAVNVTNANPPVSPIQMNKKRFTYSEVIKMTNNFQRVVGEGGFAVKLLSQSSTQGYKQFKAEVDLLMRVHHTNLVNLVGYCNEGDHLALIHEYVPNGDLRHHLSGKGGRSIINWGIRLRIALEATSGLEYLHIGCIPAMVHRDVKTTNILLEEQFKARLADFGGESHVSTMIAGTPGYLDPEYYRTSRLTEKSDVYSFGIVLLEMITNQPVIDQSRKKSHITQWVEFELISGDIRTIMDPNLQGDYDSHSAWRVLDLAMSCANPSSTKRPSMSQVVVELKECLASENSRRNMKRGRMDSHGQAKVSMLIDTGIFPEAR
uniref:Protein kinase domain-containing protein n=1 Tax=Brassica oleracea var. oleracea TaxID=109376 RepID=A0A0D3ECU1_BRAOL